MYRHEPGELPDMPELPGELGLLSQGISLGLCGQLALLEALRATVGLGYAGMLTGLAYAVGALAILTLALWRSGARSWGPANGVTATRAVLVGGVTALMVECDRGQGAVVAIVVMSATALVLDGVDGRVARSTGTSSSLGARFDMEVDAFLLLALSVYDAADVGVWVLAIGAMRYVFVAAAQLEPWLRAPLPPRFSRKTIAAVQGIVLVVVAAGILPRPAAAALAGVSLVSLLWSFGRDVLHLHRTRRSAVDGWRRTMTPASPPPRA